MFTIASRFTAAVKAILDQAHELLDAVKRGEYPDLHTVRLLFNAETTEESKLHHLLSLENHQTKLELVLQTLENRRHDLCPKYEQPNEMGDYMKTMATKIGDPTMKSREVWLATRGSDKGRADEDGFVIDDDDVDEEEILAIS